MRDAGKPMALTPGRCVAIFIVGAAAMLAGGVGVRHERAERWRSGFGQGMSERAARLVHAVRILERRDSIVRSLAGRTTTTGFETSVSQYLPARERAALDSVARAHWNSVVAGPARIRTVVVIPVDAPSSYRGVGNRAIRTTVTPEHTDGRTCVAIIGVVAKSSPSQGGAPRATIVPDDFRAFLARGLAPCVFFARYGLPGRGVSAWLSATNYMGAASTAPASRVDPLEDAPPSTASLLSYRWGWHVGLEALGCASGREGDCPNAWNARYPGDGWYAPLPPGFIDGSRFVDIGPLGTATPHFLAQVEASEGPEKFARFWTSDLPMDSALAAATGAGLGEHALRSLRLNIGEPHATPWLSAIEWVAYLSVLALAFVGLRVAASHRQIFR